VGYLDLPVNDDALLLLAWLYQSPTRGVAAGVCRTGVAGLAEEKGWTERRVRKALKELKGYVLVDERARVMFIVGAIRQDPPQNQRQLIAIARQFSEIPACAVLAAAATEVTAAVANYQKSLTETWQRLNRFGVGLMNHSDDCFPSDPEPDPDPDPDSGPKSVQAAALPRLSRVLTEIPSENFGVITKIAHEMIDQLGPQHPDLSEAVKHLCAKGRIAYDSRTVAAAVDSACFQRRARSAGQM
jgi:hypothetical protein